MSGAPASYEPGKAYQLEVLLRRAGMLRAGFQLAVRFADGAASGAQAGVLASADARSIVTWDTLTHVSYIEHNLAGTALAGDAERGLLRAKEGVCTLLVRPSSAALALRRPLSVWHLHSPHGEMTLC